MTKPCMTCHHKADSHQRGIIILENGKKLRPYSGKCKEQGCDCVSYRKIDGLVISKAEVKQIFKLKKRFLESKSKDRQRMVLHQIKEWWQVICLKYELDIKKIMSIKKDGRIILKSKRMLTIPINNNFTEQTKYEDSRIQIKTRKDNRV